MIGDSLDAMLGSDTYSAPAGRTQELDGEAHRTARFDLVLDLGRDGLRSTGAHDDVERRMGSGPKAKFTALDA